jgi:hypothetical protein
MYAALSFDAGLYQLALARIMWLIAKEAWSSMRSLGR